MVYEINGVGGNNSMVVSLSKWSPFVAEAPGPDSSVTTLQECVYGFLLAVWTVDIVHAWSEHLFRG